MTREAVVAEARSWTGTKVRHQHAIKGHGVDCWNLVREVGQACGVLAISAEAFRPFAKYSNPVRPELLVKALKRFFRPTKRPVAGDIALIAWRPGLTMHLAILAEFDGRPTLIHANGEVGAVVEHGFAGPWPDRIDSWWRYPGLARRRS